MGPTEPSDQTDVTSPTEVAQPEQAAAPPQPAIMPTTVIGGTAQPLAQKSARRLPKKLIAIVAGFVILMGGSAAAYLGVVVPAQPENVLRRAIANTLDKDKMKFKGIATAEGTGDRAFAMKMDFEGEADSALPAAKSTLDITVNGVEVPLEFRSIDKAVYVKFGDLSTLSGLAGSAGPQYASLAQTLGQKLSGQWIEIDETLLKSAKLDCALISTRLTEDDIKLIMDRYAQKQFATIRSSSDDTVDGRAMTKFELEIDNKRADEFGDGLQELSAVKRLKECEGLDKANKTAKTSEGKTPLTLWVDKSTDTVSKISLSTTPEMEAKDKVKGSFEATLTYGQASITKPEGAKPLMQVISDLSSQFRSPTPVRR